MNLSDILVRLGEVERRMANVIRMGVVSEVDQEGAQVRVQIGALITGWLPWLTQRAGADRTWWAPSIGEQVIVLSPSGETAAGVALPAIYRTDHPAPSNDTMVHRTVYSDGTVVEYDKNTGTLKVDAKTKVKIIAPTTEITGNVTVAGGVTVTGGDVVADGISLKTHTHNETDSVTGPPNP